MNKAIEKAIEGGWIGIDLPAPDMFKWSEKRYEDNYKKAGDALIFLDPVFWQTLGVSLGWKGRTSSCHNAGIKKFPENTTQPNGSIIPEWFYFCVVCKEKCKVTANKGWREQWHNFIDHLASGGDAESFFENLL